MNYIVNGEELHHCGHNGISKTYFFTRVTKEKNQMVEIPYSFDGVIVPVEENLSQ